MTTKLPVKVRRWTRCALCGRKVAQPLGRGRPREVHDECRKYRNALNQLRSLVTEAKRSYPPCGKLFDCEEEGPSMFVPRAIAELRAELFDLSNEIPRVRDSKGRFIKTRR